MRPLTARYAYLWAHGIYLGATSASGMTPSMKRRLMAGVAQALSGCRVNAVWIGTSESSHRVKDMEIVADLHARPLDG